MTIKGKNITFTRNPAMPKDYNAAIEFIAQKVETAGSTYCAYHDTDNRACGVGWMMSRETRRQIKRSRMNEKGIIGLVRFEMGDTEAFETEIGLPMKTVCEIQQHFDRVTTSFRSSYPEPHKEIAKRIRAMKV